MAITINKENNKLYLEGTLIKLIYAPLVTYIDGKEKVSKEAYYQLAVKAPEDKGAAQNVRTAYYTDVADNFIPKWVRGEEKPDAKGEIYYNFKSLYDLKYFLPNEEGNYSNALSYDDLCEKCNGVAPLGSRVLVSIRCKEGALYADAIKFLDVKKVTVDSYFA